MPDGMDETFKNYFDEYRAKDELPPEIAGRIGAKLFGDMEKLDVWRNINFGRGRDSRSNSPNTIFWCRAPLTRFLSRRTANTSRLISRPAATPSKKIPANITANQLDFYALLFERNGLPPAQNGYLLFFLAQKIRRRKSGFQHGARGNGYQPEPGRANPEKGPGNH